MDEVKGEDGVERIRIVPTNYPPNSHKVKETLNKPDDGPKKIEKIVTGKVIQKKKTLARKIAETFIGDDIGSASNFVLFEVIIPATKNMIREGVSEGVERLLFGEVRGHRPGGLLAGRSNYVSYDKYSAGANKPATQRELSRRGRASHDFSEIELDSRGEVEAVIDNLLELISDYGVATISDLYEMVGIPGNFVDRKWGWTNLDDATATRVRGGNGYKLNIPRPQPLD